MECDLHDLPMLIWVYYHMDCKYLEMLSATQRVSIQVLQRIWDMVDKGALPSGKDPAPLIWDLINLGSK